MAKPYLLYVVGAAKSGTSWLYRVFASHPDCHVRAVKELHYWDSLSGRARKSQLRQFRAKLDQHRRNREEAEARGDKVRMRGQTRQMRALEELMAIIEGASGDHAAYLDFTLGGAEGKVLAADITPSYASQPVEVLREMAGVAEETRFLYLLRDPLARLWSHVRMLVARSGVGDEDFEAEANRLLAAVLSGAEPSVLDRGDYAAAGARLVEAVPEGRLCVAFAEDVLTQPGFDALCDMLDITRREVPVTKRVHAGRRAVMDDALVPQAMELLAPQYDWVRRLCPEMPDAWQDSMKRVAA
jgi:hypothetical protein